MVVVEEETCPHCGAVLDVQRALERDGAVLRKPRREE